MTKWVKVQKGKYRKDCNDFVLSVSSYENKWWWSTWREDVSYQSGVTKKLLSGKILSTRAMNNK